AVRSFGRFSNIPGSGAEPRSGTCPSSRPGFRLCVASSVPAAYFTPGTSGRGNRMNWITNYVRPRINSLFSRREVPENLWTKCPECGTMLFHRELADNLNVCSNCDHHLAI